MKEERPAVMLYSGGMDSFIVWNLMGHLPAVYFKLRTEAMERELAVLPVGIPRWDDISLANHEQSNGYVPYRNIYLIQLLSAYNPTVIMAMIREWAPDKNRPFFNRLQRLLTEARAASHVDGERVRILTPFAHLTKTQLVGEYLRLDRPNDSVGKRVDDLLYRTWSCYRGGQEHCGLCHGCLDRWIALANNGISERMAISRGEQWLALRDRLRRRRQLRGQALRAGQLGKARIYHALIRELQSTR